MTAVGIDVGKAALDVAIFGEPKVHRFSNTVAGIRRLIRLLQDRENVRIVVEATGGYEEAVLAACAESGLWIARVNPRQARHFARAIGQLAKTDNLDARMLAEMVQAFHGRLHAHVPLEPWQAELRGWLRRRHQITEAIQRTRQQLAMTLPAIRPPMKKTLIALQREQTLVDAAMKQLLQAHGTPAMRSSKGLGPMFQASVLALLPELGQLRRQQIAKLVGVAPLNRDSGQSQGKRRIYGGRAEVRVALYMATLSAVRWEPLMKAHYQQLRARGKVGLVCRIICAELPVPNTTRQVCATASRHNAIEVREQKVVEKIYLKEFMIAYREVNGDASKPKKDSDNDISHWAKRHDHANKNSRRQEVY